MKNIKKSLLFVFLGLCILSGIVYAAGTPRLISSLIDDAIVSEDIITSAYFDNLNGSKSEGKYCKYRSGKLMCIDDAPSGGVTASSCVKPLNSYLINPGTTDCTRSCSSDYSESGGECILGGEISDSNCDIGDITIGTQTWAGCNSTLGNGIEYSDNHSQSCYDYLGGSGANGCDRSSSEKENIWNSSYGINNIWGKLYTWDNAMNACPTGYHLPSDDEWKTLETTLNGGIECTSHEQVGGCDGLGWKDHTLKNSTNNLVEALQIPLAGHREEDSPNIFYFRGQNAYLWSSTPGVANAGGSTAWGRNLNLHNTQTGHFTYDNDMLLSVRCIKDSSGYGGGDTSCVYTATTDTTLGAVLGGNIEDCNYDKFSTAAEWYRVSGRCGSKEGIDYWNNTPGSTYEVNEEARTEVCNTYGLGGANDKKACNDALLCEDGDEYITKQGICIDPSCTFNACEATYSAIFHEPSIEATDSVGGCPGIYATNWANHCSVGEQEWAGNYCEDGVVKVTCTEPGLIINNQCLGNLGKSVDGSYGERILEYDSYWRDTYLCGVDSYETSYGVCSPVGAGYYSPNLNQNRIVIESTEPEVVPTPTCPCTVDDDCGAFKICVRGDPRFGCTQNYCTNSGAD